MTMGALAGFIVGYVLGTKAGPEALERLRRVSEGDGNIADRVRSAVAGETREAMRRRLRTVN
jgi:membrane protein DedA with SNARE-associated domain